MRISSGAGNMTLNVGSGALVTSSEGFVKSIEAFEHDFNVDPATAASVVE